MVKRDRLDILLADNEYLRTKQEAYVSAVDDMEEHYQAEIRALKKSVRVFKSTEDTNAQTIRKLTETNKSLVAKLQLLEEEMAEQKDADGKVPDIRPEWQKQEPEEEAKADNYCRTCPRQCEQAKQLLAQLDDTRKVCEKSAAPNYLEVGLLNQLRTVQLRCVQKAVTTEVVKRNAPRSLYG
jgi:hypothetical protein